MKISLLLVAGDNKRFVAAAIESADAAFPRVSVSSADSLKEALELPPKPAPTLLLLADPTEASIAEAARAQDGGKLPRWAVVAMGALHAVPYTDVLTETDWTAAILTPVLKRAVASHVLHRERERLRGDLLTIGIRISHDLRTPVGGILSATEVLEGSPATGRPPEKSLTQPLVESANDLVKIISQLALVTKASARPDSRQPASMSIPVGRALERVEMRVRAKGAKVSNPTTWPDALADPALIEAVWVALLDNALRHSGKAPVVELGWQQEDDATKFWVRDHGSGVPPDKRQSLFQPFHRLHEPSAPRGLGLPIVERLVSIHGGECGYEGVEPHGSLFFFRLPR